LELTDDQMHGFDGPWAKPDGLLDDTDSRLPSFALRATEGKHRIAMLGAPGGSRTPNLQIRSLALYPVELRVRKRRRKQAKIARRVQA
jgi:hypothetical protein